MSRVVEGSVVENLYTEDKESDSLVEMSETVVDCGNVAYINDGMGLHKIGERE